MIQKISLVVVTISIFAIVHSCNVTQPEEHDYNYSIKKIWWTDSIDNDKDGYNVSKTLNFHVSLIENVTRKIVARIYFKLTDASSYSFYGYSEEYVIEGINSPLSMKMIIGIPNKELARGLYDFQIEIYEKNSERLEASTSIEDSIGSNLHNQAFEDLPRDQIYTITPLWIGVYDRNENGYARYATLVLDVDIKGDYEKKLTAYIYYKNTLTEKYSLYLISDEFRIRGIQLKDSIHLLIGEEGKELSKGEYDFRIELKESGAFHPVAAIDSKTSEILNNVKFESHDEDSYFYSINLGNLKWIDPIDLDGDGYTSSRKIVFDVDVDKNEYRSILTKIFVKHPDSTDYNYYNTTDVFRIFGRTPFDAIQIPIGTASFNLDSAKYNFIFTVYEDLPDSLKIIEAEVGGDEEGDILYQQKFETAVQDSLR